MTGNTALNVNSGIGGTASLQITQRGSDWYFTVCSVMGFATLVFMGLSFTKPRSERLFHYITAAVTMVACVAYFSMGSNLGQVPIRVEFPRTIYGPANDAGGDGYGTREIFYARYIDWAITTPLLLLDLLLTAGLPWPTILITIVADLFMVVTGLIGALIPSDYKWGYFSFGCAGFLYVIYVLLFLGRKYSAALGQDVSKVYNMCGVLTIFVWFIYPIAWGLCEGGNVIHPDSEAIMYGVCDLLAKPVFGALLIWGHRDISPARLGIHIRDYDEDINSGRHEKMNGHHNGNGTTTNGTNGTNVDATTV